MNMGEAVSLSFLFFYFAGKMTEYEYEGYCIK